MKANYFLAGVMALGLLASCIKEDGDTGLPGTPSVEAEATVTIKLYGQNDTFSADASKSDSVETAINNLSLLIFDNNGLLENAYSWSSTGTQTITTTAGKKTFVAVANNPDATENGHISWEVGTTVLESLLKSPFTSAAPGVSAPELSIRNNGFLMIGDSVIQDILPVEDIESGEVGASNKVTLVLTRLAAKAQLGWINPNVSPDLEPKVPEDQTISFDVATFQLANLMNKMLPQASDSISIIDAGLVEWMDIYGTTSQNWLAAETTSFTGDPDKSGYAPENIMLDTIPKMNQVTCMLIKTVIKLNGEAKDLYAVAKYKEDADTLSYMNFEGYLSLHTDSSEADTAAEALGEDYGVVKFPGGVTYYRVNLLDWKKTDASANIKQAASVRRNNYYQVTVNNILNIGWPIAGDLLDPDDNRPIEEPFANIDATIQIQDWVSVDMDGSLG